MTGKPTIALKPPPSTGAPAAPKKETARITLPDVNQASNQSPPAPGSVKPAAAAATAGSGVGKPTIKMQPTLQMTKQAAPAKPATPAAPPTVAQIPAPAAPQSDAAVNGMAIASFILSAAAAVLAYLNYIGADPR